MSRVVVLALSIAGLIVANCEISRGQSGLGTILKESLSAKQATKLVDGKRGSYTRSFWVNEPYKDVQIAFVIDATNTMKPDLTDLKGFLSAINDRIRETTGAEEIAVAFVVYRDLWESFDVKSRVVTRRESPIQAAETHFTSPTKRPRDWDTLLQNLRAIDAERGDPGDFEQVDRGIHWALTRLDWRSDTSDEKRLRLLIVAGDAPPWPEEYLTEDPDWIAKNDWVRRAMGNTRLRGFATDTLIRLANEKDIRIYTVACDTPAYEEEDSLNSQLFRFFRELSAATNGKFLNLRDPDAVAQLTADFQADEFVEIGEVSEQEVESRQNALRDNAPVSVAVLPFLPLNEMSFRARAITPPMHCYALFRKAIEESDDRGLVELDRIATAWPSVADRSDTRTEDSLLESLRDELDVDLVFWGDWNETQPGQLSIRMRSASATTRFDVPWPDKGNETRFQALALMLKKLEDAGPSARFAKLVHGHANQSLAASAMDADALAAEQQLHEAQRLNIGFEPHRERIIQHSTAALDHLRPALQTYPGDPWLLLLKAVAHRNLADEAAFKQALQDAYDNRAKCQEPGLKREIEGDYALFVENDPQAAVTCYQAIIREAGFSKAGRRARWMLAGIYAGDFCDVRKLAMTDEQRFAAAKECILDIVSYWQNSAEADAFRLQCHLKSGGPPERGTVPPAGTVIVYRN